MSHNGGAVVPPTKDSAQESTAAAAAVVPPLLPAQYKNMIRLCGSAWAPCGYCKGKRSHLARKPPPPKPAPSAAAAAADTLEDLAVIDDSAATEPEETPTAPEHRWQQNGTAGTCCSAPEPESSMNVDNLERIVDGSCTSDNSRAVEKDGDSFYWEQSSKAYSILATNLTTACYERLIERGWRRSGSAIYKPSNFVSCCPALTIRLQAKAYRPTKSQVKVMRRMNQLLLDDNNNNNKNDRHSVSQKTQHLRDDNSVAAWLVTSKVVEQWHDWTRSALIEIVGLDVLPQLPPVLYKRISTPTTRHKPNGDDDNGASTTEVLLRTTVCAAIAGRSNGSIDRSQLAQKLVRKLEQDQRTTVSDDPSFKLSCHSPSGQVFVHLTKPQPLPPSPGTDNTKVGRDTRRACSGEGTTWNNNTNNNTNNTNKDSGNRLTAWLRAHTSLIIDPPYKLNISTVPAHESALDPQVHRLYWEYQHVVHQDPNPLDTSTTPSLSSVTATTDDKASEHAHTPADGTMEETAVTTAVSADIVGDDWGREHSPKGWRELVDSMLATEYGHLPPSQQQHLKRSFASFYEFLVENPFETEENKSKANKARHHIPLGSYHQHYTLSGNVLIAVGVVDILPTGLSSVYLFYSPSFSHQLVPLGKFAIDKEIEWTTKAGLPYYYLGYYIESCPKMNYKGNYHPSELLCPTTNRWVDAQSAKHRLLQNSPEHHCCTLYLEEDEHVDDCENEKLGSVGGDGGDSSKRCRTQPPHQGENIVDRIPIDIGAGMLVTIGMLQPEGQNIIRPLLQEFADEVGPDTAGQCFVNLR